MLKRALLLVMSLSFLLVIGCTPNEGKIKGDLMGKSTYRAGVTYWYEFEKKEEIKSFKITNKKQTKDSIEYVIEMKLENHHDKEKYFLELLVDYKKEKSGWVIKRLHQQKFNKLK